MGARRGGKSGPSLIAAKWAGKCRTCGTPHAASTDEVPVWVEWVKGVKGVQCASCAKKAPTAKPAVSAAERAAGAANKPMPVDVLARELKDRAYMLAAYGEPDVVALVAFVNDAYQVLCHYDLRLRPDDRP
jgi:hypothetical protein